MITCTTRRKGNSIVVIIPKDAAESLQLRENQQIVVDIVATENPLKELFGFSKSNKITEDEFKETRRLLESSRM